MSIYLSKNYRQTAVKDLPLEIRNEIMMAVEESLNHQVKTVGNMDSDSYQQAWDTAYHSKAGELNGLAAVEFVDEQLSYYVVENLRYQQDGSGRFKVDRFENLQDAIMAFAALPKEYTSALGASLTGGKYGIGEIDLIHRRTGDVVQVNDFKFIERWDNPLVHRAVNEINSKFGVEYESDLRLLGGKTVIVPLQPWEPQKLNSYYKDKYLRPAEGAEEKASRRYRDLSVFGPDHPARSEHLLSAINEVMVPGEGWVNGQEFLARLDAVDEYASPVRFKISKLNINYVDINGREGQADISPADFGFLKKQTIERTAELLDLDEQIEAANKIRLEQMEKKNDRDLGKDKDKGKKVEDPVR